MRFAPGPSFYLIRILGSFIEQRRAAAGSSGEIDLNIATDNEKQRLKAWKLYRVKFNCIEQQCSFSIEIEWPKPPDEN
ncbi:tail fiber assembly protein [Mycoavidus sp. SF9855]|uniref:tail fiber assembly protein n=1 Tax=Mycoavidus sp. SF9855 TaxID=2968475 RepID=UPI00211D1331|nr:tail fiber assembly protein [Mycoavidus sp. SF9855]UUM20807.1 tail fiber assembly protein [Mycoavidus sp. SF9855]